MSLLSAQPNEASPRSRCGSWRRVSETLGTSTDWRMGQELSDMTDGRPVQPGTCPRPSQQLKPEGGAGEVQRGLGSGAHPSSRSCWEAAKLRAALQHDLPLRICRLGGHQPRRAHTMRQATRLMLQPRWASGGQNRLLRRTQVTPHRPPATLRTPHRPAEAMGVDRSVEECATELGKFFHLNFIRLASY